MTRPKAKRLPALPASVPSAMGAIPVEIVEALKLNDEALCGRFSWQKRLIQVEQKMTREAQWYTLYHEMVHVALSDSGVAQVLDERQTEAVCDALALARLEELKAGRR
jgi:Zn-dependent peptidase ImmA (M78 family)